MLKYIFFDLDDTILNFTAGEANALSQALSEAGIIPTQAVLDRYHVINQACWELLEEGRLTRDEVQWLRRSVREAGASIKVYKATLVHIALEDAELPTLDDMLNGPSAFVFAGEDVAAAAKAVKNFAKGNDKLEIKGGLMEGKAVTAAEVEAIASLPSREELLAHIAAAINGVAKALAVCVNGVPQGLAQVTKAVADQKAA